ncbi:M23 family metallopeptidase [Agromyces intestinalis]|uniref:M23 family metallopeptidase n=1 Tax=Agromyces intestinalis TaxID=2592652 RepID=A0A5C1YJV1_9MICO|nr:M23 family metallopeptidase [Agromyces intestinalis]QEO15540.1 M23 family metallopeptidase [Agromyces intestinalis]
MTLPPHGRRAAATPPHARFTRLAAGARRSGGTRPLLASLGLTFAAGLFAATSIPALALTATAPEDQPVASVYEPVVEDTIVAAPQTVDSHASIDTVPDESYVVELAPPPITSQVAGLGTISLVKTAAIVWPVVDPSRTSSGFGPREAPCGGCSTYHDGIDFTPGSGTPVMSLADGVVVLATENGGGLGVNVEVQHNIDGQIITSSYAHMQFGSIAVSVGQQVSAGQQLGLVGTTGQSTGPHLHLEMFGADGVRFDGMAWLKSRLG